MADSRSIYLLNYCGNRSRYDVFWDPNLSWNTSSPDVSRCMQQTVISPGVCAIFWVLFLCYLPWLRERPVVNSIRNAGIITIARLVTALLLVLLSAVEVVYYTVEVVQEGDDAPYPSIYIDALIRLITYILAAVFVVMVSNTGKHSSAILVLFYFLKLLFGIVNFRSQILQKQQNKIKGYLQFSFVCTFIEFGLILGSFILNNIVDHSACAVEHKYRTPEQEMKHPSDWNNQGDKPKNLCPELTAATFTRLFFIWFTRMVHAGYKRTLHMGDIWDIREENSSQKLVPEFQPAWEAELRKCNTKKRNLYIDHDSTEGGVNNDAFVDSEPELTMSNDRSPYSGTDKDPSLFRALLTYAGYQYILPGILMIFYDVIILINPMLLRATISFIEGDGPFAWHGYLYAVCMFVCSLSSALCMHHKVNFVCTAGMRVRAALSAAIYRKSLKLSCVSRKEASVGEVVNLMSVDTQKIKDSAPYLHYLWSVPLVVVLATVLLWQVLGPSSLAGVIFLLLALPINSAYMKKKREYQRHQMKLKDKRVKMTNQVLNGMKVLKLYAWEIYFMEKVVEIRTKELHYLRKSAILGAFIYVVWNTVGVMGSLLCFMTYVLVSEENILDAETAFVSISILQSITYSLLLLPMAIRFVVEFSVSVKRINKFLLLEEMDPATVKYCQDKEKAVSIKAGTFSWGEADRTTLKDITLDIPKGSLVAIVGPVGSGKSSLISAILGDIKKIKGQVHICGSQAYVPQQAWIQNLSLQDNILFGKRIDKQEYERMLDACALLPDIRILPGGDKTEIGEKGINLSGGQKQRVSLARAVYKDADMYLLDDPLSAVDAHVGKHIFEKVIGPNGLLKGKTRVLVTHGISYLASMDFIVVIKDGRIAETGTYHELIKQGGYISETEQTTIDDLTITDSKVNTVIVPKKEISDQEKPTTHEDKTKENKAALISKERAAEGSLNMDVLRTYAEAASTRVVIILLVSITLTVASQVGTNIWLSEWTNDEIINGTQDIGLRNIRLGVYGALGISQALFGFAMAMAVALGGVNASEFLHSKLFYNILRCPMSFFDTTPLGRIVNRFSKDMDMCDANIPHSLRTFLSSIALIMSTFIIISYTLPVLIAVFIPLAFLFFLIQRLHTNCARQLRRMDSIKRSPMYAFFSETLAGTSSIRAYKEQERFIQHSDRLLDISNQVWFTVFSSNRWIGICGEAASTIVVLSTSLLCVSQRHNLDSGLVGLSLSFALQISMSLVLALRSSCELETYIVAVERVKEYIDAPNEAEWIVSKNRPPDNWPSQGEVSFNDYTTRYRSGLDLVLKGLSCDIKSKEKVGIVGRTGAGKSSMTLALFRIIEPAGGTIKIDGVDITSLGLHDVRNKITIIPQDPILFSGSIRFNIDPSGSLPDADIWNALEHAHLHDFVSGLQGKLEYNCGEEGGNLSVGQRQLVCLARALLKKAKILVLDEATAAVDMETDELIQKTIKESFSNYTVITIAHRINTILDYDRVMVMEDGNIAEFDSPDKLRKRNDSLFSSLMHEAGFS